MHAQRGEGDIIHAIGTSGPESITIMIATSITLFVVKISKMIFFMLAAMRGIASTGSLSFHSSLSRTAKWCCTTWLLGRRWK